MFSSIYSLILTITHLDSLRIVARMLDVPIFKRVLRCRNRDWPCFTNTWNTYVRTFGCPHVPLRFTLPCHTASMPTFLRTTSQGVDAVSCSLTGSLPLWCRYYGLSVLLFVLVFIVYKRVNRTNEFESVKQPSVFGTSEVVPVNPQRCTKLALSPMCVEHE